MRAGRLDEARQHLTSGTAEHARDAAWRSSAGNIALELGDPKAAAEHFGKAAGLEPDNPEYAINYGIALTSAGRPQEALVSFARVEGAGRNSAQYCSARGAAERAAGDKSAAALWYDRALAIEPTRAKALHGRARVAIERGEDTALGRFERALSVNPGDADLWLGRAQSLDVKGDTAGARSIAEQLADQAPHWEEGLKFLAQLRLAAGEPNFASHYGQAMDRVPQDPNIPVAWASILAGLDFNEEAAEVAAKGGARFPEHQLFALLEAIYAGAAGEDDRAEKIFSVLQMRTTDRLIHEARHRIRRGEFAKAEYLLDDVIEDDPDSITAWALRGIVWRSTGDPREEWLHRQAGLAELRPLHDWDAVLPPAIALLHELHDNSPLPLGQSLRGGSQTRGLLFDRIEPELAALRDAIVATVEAHRSNLPPQDVTHPLLRHRDAAWQINGSWSVRLSGGGDYHTSHIHPQGVISSALYCELPGQRGDDPQAGWLELGRPPPDLRLDLPPIRTIEPIVGHLALFPSTLYHGTRPFAEDRRMTVAFDVTLRPEAN